MTSPSPRIRIVVADDHLMFREGVRRLLATEPDFEVVGEAGDAAGAAAVVRQARPDVLLLDLAMPGGSGLDTLRELADSDIGTRIVVLTAAIDRMQLVQALQLGARGMVMKDTASAVLFESIRGVAAGRYWLGGGPIDDLATCLRQALGREPAAGRDVGLTPREREILAALIEGAGNRDIAERFGLSEVTVKHHLTSMFDKCGVSTRLELALFAVRHGIARL